ncbi:hypothetical protein DFH09DRAFT_1093263 [Mycena vulgaris]|nr:hypothetical protein DFH09DRAFT_1093263 [Mycena vulgaris]
MSVSTRWYNEPNQLGLPGRSGVSLNLPPAQLHHTASIYNPTAQEAHFAAHMAAMNWHLRRGTKIVPISQEEWRAPSQDTASASASSVYQALSAAPMLDPRGMRDGGQTHQRVASWTADVAGVESGDVESHRLEEYMYAHPVQDSFAPQPHSMLGLNAPYPQVYPTQPYRPCPECLFFECPNTTGECECPYATVYDVPDRYDARVRMGLRSEGYGYEHLPASSNPRGWTFESTGCRLYSLGLKNLAPAASDEGGTSGAAGSAA